MTVRLLKFALYAAALIAIFAGLVGLVSVVANDRRRCRDHDFSTADRSGRVDPRSTDSSGAAVGTLLLDKGTLNVRSGGVGYAALQAETF